MHVYLGADHHGFGVKEAIKAWLITEGHTVTDKGAASYTKEDDYPKIAFAVAKDVAKEEGSRGILVCGSGSGVCIAANKINGCYCSVGLSVEQVKATRNDDDCNTLALAADFVTQQQAIRMVEAFLVTTFAKKERYMRRINEIKKQEERYV